MLPIIYYRPPRKACWSRAVAGADLMARQVYDLCFQCRNLFRVRQIARAGNVGFYEAQAPVELHFELARKREDKAEVRPCSISTAIKFRTGV